MDKVELNIPGAFVLTPKRFEDERGIFFEWFQREDYAHGEFNLAQANCSISKKGTLRGLHFALMPIGQRKHVTCMGGRALDVLVDLRVSSPEFGKWITVDLNMDSRKIVSIPNGVGHGFLALEDNTVITYLCDQKYNPENEMEIYPLDPEIGIDWTGSDALLISEKDSKAPNLRELMPLLSVQEW